MTETGDHRVFLDAIKGVQVQFWTCPNKDHRSVTWTGDVASCDTCGITSEMTARLIRAAAEYERNRIENAISWQTSCLSCATVLDSCYAETCRREQAEEKLAALTSGDQVTVGREDLRTLMRLAEDYAGRDPLRLVPSDSCRKALGRLSAAAGDPQ